MLALLLAAIGLYGVLAQYVAQRGQEIGVRLALGARPADMMRLVARQGGLPVAAGLASGLAAAVALGRIVRGLLYQVEPSDPTTLVTISLTLLASAVVAIAVPARRAVQTDPMSALRQE